MRILPMLWLIPCAVVMTSCSVKVKINDHKDEAAAIRKIDEQWSAAAGKNDLDGTVSFYASDAVLLPPNAPIATNAKAIRESWAGLLGPNTAVSWKPTQVDVAKSGELGYLHGTYELTIKDPKGGAPVHDTGKMVEVWKKQADGGWKCVADIYNSDLPVVVATEKEATK